MWQVFAVNDQTTARYLSERLGHHNIAWREYGRPRAWNACRTGPPGCARRLSSPRESSRDSGNQLVLVEGRDKFLLRRTPYDWTFEKEHYSPNPYEAAPPLFSTARFRVKA